MSRAFSDPFTFRFGGFNRRLKTPDLKTKTVSKSQRRLKLTSQITLQNANCHSDIFYVQQYLQMVSPCHSARSAQSALPVNMVCHIYSALPEYLPSCWSVSPDACAPSVESAPLVKDALSSYCVVPVIYSNPIGYSVSPGYGVSFG